MTASNRIAAFLIVSLLVFGGISALIGNSAISADDTVSETSTEPEIMMASTFGGEETEYFSSVKATSDGGFVAVGVSTEGSFGSGDLAGLTGRGASDGIIVKYSASGTVEWAKNFGGSGDDTLKSVTTTSDGGFVAVGYSQAASFGNGDLAGLTGRGDTDAIIVKFDASGTVEWAKNFGGAGSDAFNSVTTTSDGGFVAVGLADSASFGNGDLAGVTGRGIGDGIIVKFNASGTVEWAKNFGGSNINRFECVTTTSDGGFVAVGYSAQGSFGNGDWTGVTGRGGIDAIIVKFNASGTVEWAKNFGGAGSDAFNSVTTTSDGGFVAVGSAGSTSFGNGDLEGVTGRGGDDAIIVKYSASGTVEWAKNFGGASNDYFYSVNTSSNGGFVAVGRAISTSFGNGDLAGLTGRGGTDAIIVKFNASGTVGWAKNFGGIGGDEFNSVTETYDGNLVAVGSSHTNSFGNGDWTGVIGRGTFEAIVVKFTNPYINDTTSITHIEVEIIIKILAGILIISALAITIKTRRFAIGTALILIAFGLFFHADLVDLINMLGGPADG